MTRGPDGPPQQAQDPNVKTPEAKSYHFMMVTATKIDAVGLDEDDA